MNNRFNIDCAWPGFCSLCHCEIAEFDGFMDFGNTKRPKVKFLKPNFRQGMVTLSDGTIMSVSLCDKCIDFTPEQCSELYASEMRGWEAEVSAMDGHVKHHESMVEHLNTQRKVSIVDREDIKWTKEEKLRINKSILSKEINEKD